MLGRPIARRPEGMRRLRWGAPGHRARGWGRWAAEHALRALLGRRMGYAGGWGRGGAGLARLAASGPRAWGGGNGLVGHALGKDTAHWAALLRLRGWAGGRGAAQEGGRGRDLGKELWAFLLCSSSFLYLFLFFPFYLNLVLVLNSKYISCLMNLDE
jgi:hypothetical protein